MANLIYASSIFDNEIAIAKSQLNPGHNSYLIDRLISPTPSPEEQYIFDKEVENVLHSLGDFREYFALFYMHDYTLKEASAMMNVSQRTFQRRLDLGKEKILAEVQQ